MFWFAAIVVGSIVQFWRLYSNETRANCWCVVAICLPLLIAVATTIWFTIGCWHDMREFFGRLREDPLAQVSRANDFLLLT